jgi:hypothetical protein
MVERRKKIYIVFCRKFLEFLTPWAEQGVNSEAAPAKTEHLAAMHA